MKGRWVAVLPNGQSFIDSLSVVLDQPDATGRVTGRLTSRGVTCGALDEPLVGTWDGTELRFESRVKPNVNAQRMNGNCDTGRIEYVLKRKPGDSRFEGQARRDGSPVAVEVTLSP
jgi:hypothetical protein